MEKTIETLRHQMVASLSSEGKDGGALIRGFLVTPEKAFAVLVSSESVARASAADITISVRLVHTPIKGRKTAADSLSQKTNESARDQSPRSAHTQPMKLTIQGLSSEEAPKTSFSLKGTHNWQKILTERKNCTNLDFSSCSIRNVELKTLLKERKNSSCIEVLNLANNQIKREGLEALRKFLVNHTTFRNLNLSGNGICSEGAFFLAEAIEKNRHLKSIHLSNCRLGSRALCRLLEARYVNKAKGGNLRELTLNGNLNSENLPGFHYLLHKKAKTLIREKNWNRAIWLMRRITEKDLRVKTFTILVKSLVDNGELTFAKGIILNEDSFPPDERNRLLVLLAERSMQLQELDFTACLLWNLPEEERKRFLNKLFQTFLECENLERAQDMLEHMERNSKEWESALHTLTSKWKQKGNVFEADYLLSLLSRMPTSELPSTNEVTGRNREAEQAMQKEIEIASRILEDSERDRFFVKRQGDS